MLDNKVLNMSPGDALMDAPIADMIQKLGLSIAEAQLRLDQVGVQVATLLSDAKVDFKNDAGETTTKSLLELGFIPSFYQFTETEIEVKLTIQLKVEEGIDVEGEAAVAGATKNRAVAFGASINVEYHRKYDFDMTGSSSVKTKLIAIPPPSVFLEMIKTHTPS